MQNQKYKIFERDKLIITNDEKDLEDLICCICSDVLFQPVKFDCQRHSMCQMCIVNQNQCPICRCEITFVKPDQQLLQQLEQLTVQCPLNCGNIKYHKMYSHILVCENQSEFSKYVVKILEETKIAMIKLFDKEITPHLIDQHNYIYLTFLDQWNWLSYLDEDWKWWWWSKTAWWANNICQTCNHLWHKYEDEIEKYETIRRHFIKQL